MLIGILQVGITTAYVPSGVSDLLPVTVAQQLLKLQPCCGNEFGKSERANCLRSLSIPYDPCTLSTVGQMGAQELQPENKKEELPADSYLSPRPGNISRELRNGDRPRCARLRAISRPFLPPCPVACAKFSGGLMLGSIVGMLSRLMRSTRLPYHRGAQDPRLLEELERPLEPSRRRMPRTMRVQLSAEGWGRPIVIALRYLKKEPDSQTQYQLFDTPKYIYRVFVTT